jgi:hypothetical protein
MTIKEQCVRIEELCGIVKVLEDLLKKMDMYEQSRADASKKS